MLANIATFPARDIDSDLQVHCMGSYRRGQKDCGDIDLLVTRSTDTDGGDHRGQLGLLDSRFEYDRRAMFLRCSFQV